MDKDAITRAINHELSRAEEKHPYWPDDIIHATAIMNEEAGEAIRAAINLTYEANEFSHERLTEELQKEVIQTAAMCHRILLNL